MDQLNVLLFLTGAVVVVIGLHSNTIKGSPLSEPIIALLIGVLAGPHALGWLDVSRYTAEPEMLEQAARITLAIGLMEVALRLRPESVRVLWRPVAVLLTVVMSGMWLTSAAVMGTLLGLPFGAALLLGAVLTPTDPVVASSLVTGRFATDHLPLRVRDTISFESGANDGLAYMFVTLPALMLDPPGDATLRRWFVESVLIGVGGPP
ncbi:MAG: cation:proton antiporter [Vicinamibacterales bacterium]